MSSASPFALAARDLLALGYSVLPLTPPDAGMDGAGKAPGEYRAGAWRLMGNWPQYRDRQPTDFELGVWCSNWPAANIGIVLGSPAGAERVIAADIDSSDPDEVDEILRCLPASPMTKKGAKGLTLFYRAPGTIKSRGYKVGEGPKKRTLVDLLTGNQTRQTAAPPSRHPDGMDYVWLAGPVRAADLPLFDEDCLAVLEETLQGLGWNTTSPVEQRAVVVHRDSDEPPTVWRDLNEAALANLAAWVPTLDLHGLRPARGGYEAVPTWRSSSTGQPLEKRKRNLKIHPDGIRDMGDDRAFTALDLIQQSEGWDLERAFAWLGERLGKPTEIVLTQPARVIHEASGELIDSVTGEIVEVRSDDQGELPDHLTRPAGLVGDLTDWICATARKPSRVLAFGAALVIVGTIAGRQFAGPTRTGMHLYVLPLGPTGVGKDHPLNQITRVMTQSKLGQHIGPSEFISMPAAIKFIGRSPLSICPMDEFGSFLKRINNRRASGFEGAISGVLRTAWGKSYATMTTPEWAQVESRTIHAPALSIYGPSTPEEFYASLAAADATNGVLNRFLILGTNRRSPEVEPAFDPGEVPPGLTERLRAIYYAQGDLNAASRNQADMDIKPVIVPWADEAAQSLYAEFARSIEKRSDEDALAGAFLGRTVEMAQRIATICAVGRDGPAARVTAGDMALGRDVALWSGEAMIQGASEHMAENEQQQQTKLVLGIVRQFRTIARNQLVHRIFGRMDGRTLDGILKGLCEGEMIHEARVTHGKNGGRPRTVYIFGGPPETADA